MYRFPYLKITLGDQNLSINPPEFVKELVVTMYNSGTAQFVVTLFDATWITIPLLFQRAYDLSTKRAVQTGIGGKSAPHVPQIALSFGWQDIEGQRFDNLEGRFQTIGYTLSPDGIEYKIMGVFDLAIKVPKSKPNETYEGTVSEIASQLVDSVYGEGLEKIIEPSDDPSMKRTVDKGLSALTWISGIAVGVKPVNKHTSTQGDLDEALLNTYSAYFDIYGRFHFHTPGFAYQGKRATKTLRYPYPLQENPVISMSFAEFVWHPEAVGKNDAARKELTATPRVKGAQVERDTGEMTKADGKSGTGEAGGGIENAEEKDTRQPVVPITVPHLDAKDFVRHANRIQELISQFVTKADLVVMGDISYQPDDIVRVVVTPPRQEDQEAVSFLSGLYKVVDVVHTVNSEGFTTGLSLSHEIKATQSGVVIEKKSGAT
jgi:hypothetical protein